MADTEADSQLTEFCDCFFMSNKIAEPTRVTNNFASLIDVILTSNPERFALSGTIKLDTSDDDLIRHHTKAENSYFIFHISFALQLNVLT